MFSISIARAMTIKCERYSTSSVGFANKEVMEDWYPSPVTFSADDFEIPADKGKKQLVKFEKIGMGKGGKVKLIWRLLPNGKMLAVLPSKAGYQTPSPGRYKCDRNSLEVRAALAG